MNTFLLACTSIAMSVAAQFSLKAGMQQVRLQTPEHGHASAWAALLAHCNTGILVGFALYGLGAVVWLAVLNKWDVSKAYPLIGMGFIATLLVGAAMGENVTTARVTGVGLIACGVLLVSRS